MQLIALQSGRCVDLDINTVWNKARVYNRSKRDVGLYTQLTDSSSEVALLRWSRFNKI